MASDDELGGESFEDSSPLSPLQQGMLFQSLTAAGADPNLIQITGALQEAIDPELFDTAWQKTVERHEALRMSFHTGHTPKQRIHKRARAPFVFQDLSGLPLEVRTLAIEEFAKNQQQPFELSVSPLMRIALVQCGPEDFRLIWTLHHLIADARSFVVVLLDVFAAYEALRDGRKVEDSQRPRYRDFVKNVTRRAVAEDFWRKQFAGITHITPFASRSGEGVSREERIDLHRPLASKLRELAAASGTTLTTIIQAAWALLLSRYTGEEDVVFGVVRAGRRADCGASPDAAGLFISTLPLRTRVSPEARVLDWLRDVRNAWRELREHEHTALGEIQRCTGISGPLFDTIVSVQDPAWDDSLRLQGGAWNRRNFRIRNRTAYAASLDVYAGETLRITLNWTAPAEAVARRALQHLQVILEQWSTQPERRVSDTAILTEEEKHLLEQWNSTVVDIDLSRRVDELVADRARYAPDALAVQCGVERVTYRELNERAEVLAAQLRNAGIGPEVLAAVYMERSVDLIVALLAVLKAGGAYVPIDVAYPRSRVEYVIRDSLAAVVLTHRKLAKGLDVGAARVVSLDAPNAPTNNIPDAVNGAGVENLAYIIYTSGSTGQPKGVAIEHRSLLNLVQWHRRAYNVTDEDRATQIASPAFDAAVWEIWPYLAAGASIHIPNEETRLSPSRLIRWLNEERITMVFLPTPLAEAVMAEDWPEASVLRFLLTGGDQLRRRPPVGARYTLVNHYGPTENTVVTTAGEVSPKEDGLPSIGRAISNVRIHLLDRHLQAVPIGAMGELYVAGENLAKGYWSRPDLTAERFVAGADGTRLYRTGDLARWRADGQIEFLGRLDNQVKIRGHRIELGEIECALRAHLAVSDAAVVAQSDSIGRVRLAGYVVAKEAMETAVLREYLRESLPDYMVPETFVMVKALPLTSNGKLDRKALPAVEFAASAPRYAAPRSATEDVLAGIWSDVLGRERVGIDDNFFSLGGHSLSATQVIARARGALGIDLPLKALFQSPTIRELSEGLDRPPSAESRMEPHTEENEVPLSFAQERLWFFEQLEPGKAANNIGFRLEIRGPLDVAALEKAATELVRRHASLRTVFLKRDGRPVGRVRPSQQINVAVSDLTQFPESERACAASRMAEAAARDAFDLASGPLLRLQLLKLASESQWLVVTLHHIVCDGWSMAILYRELAILYAASAVGQAATLTPLRVQYHDYARWQRIRPEAEVDAALKYWKQKLSGKLPVLDLPADHARPAAQRYNGSVVPIQIPAELTRSLEAVARREDVTLYMLLLTGFKAILHRYSGQEDIIVGAPVAGRTLLETEPLIGMFVNMLPMRSALSAEMVFRDLLQRVRATALEAYAHQQLPFEKLVEALQLERDLSRSPVFQAMLVLQNAPTETPAFAGTEVCARALHTGTAKYDITVSLENTSEGLTGFVEFNSDLFDDATMRRFCGHFETLLSGVVEDVTKCIGRLPLLTDAEREQILVTWNLTERPFAQTECVQDVFQAQVESAPDAIAAVFEDKKLTYRELNDRANAVAARLQSLGAGPEARVGICIRRSLEMLVGLLGILKSGAAYVPLDPMYPRERLAFMLEDAQVHALLTERPLASDFAQAKTRVVCVEDIATPGFEKSVCCGAVPDNLAYVIYTSGSTGKPKGVMIRHRNVTNFFAGMDQVLGKTPGVWLAVTSICFDISVLELLWTVTRGFKVVIQSDEGGLRASTARRAQDAGYEIPDQIRRNGVTHFQCTPSLMGMLLQEKGAWEAMASVSTVLLGGEALPASLLEQLQGPQRIINMYGPTETTVWSTSQVIERGRPITIGRPLANTKIYILDRFQQPTPIGIPGELHIGGAGVVRGYLNRPELTAERFVQNPFASEPGERMYRTGDLARYRADGAIEFLGRLDHQVKLRGFRIELGEIEAALRQLAGIHEAVVVVREVSANDKRLAAYLVADKATEASQLRCALKERLPDYMVPSLLTFLPKLPLTPNGKIDRKALPEPDGLRAVASATFAPAQSDTEQKIAEIWRDLLRVEQVGLNDNFFDLGGHSLLMVRAQAKIATVFGKELPVLQLFQYPTIGALAKVIGESPGERIAFDKIKDRARLQRRAFAWGPGAEVAA